MILVDIGQVSIAQLMAESRGSPTFNADLIRHMILNNLRQLRNKFHSRYGELVLCFDANNYWRKELFPYYKANRKKIRDKQTFDWNEFYTFMDQFRMEMEKVFPYKVVRVPRCEADDVIAVLASDTQEPTLIVSEDKDFTQLLSSMVSLYRPVKRELITLDSGLSILDGTRTESYSGVKNTKMDSNDVQRYIREHILRGDDGDGIPNILSDDDTFVVESKRQKPLQSKKVEEWLASDQAFQSALDQYPVNTDRNKRLVLLTEIPSTYKEAIREQYALPVEGHRRNILAYFMQYRMRLLTESLGDF